MEMSALAYPPNPEVTIHGVPERGPVTARNRGDEFIPILWDPVHLVAADFLQHIWPTLHDQIGEAVAVVMELGGAGEKQIPEEELAAFYVVLAKAVCVGARMSTRRRGLFLQRIASDVYHRLKVRSFSDTLAFWAFLMERDDAYTATVRASRETKPLLALIDHFLSHFGLGGSENVDVVNGIHRFLSPLLRAASQAIQEWNPDAVGGADLTP